MDIVLRYCTLYYRSWCCHSCN